MAKLSQDELVRFLDEACVAHLVTLRPNGKPHVAPVWYVWDGSRAVVMAGQDAIKVKNIRRNPAVSLSIAAAQRPYQYVIIEGQATATRDDLDRQVRRICVRYDGPERGEAFARELLAEERMVLLGIEVDRMISWKEDMKEDN